MISKKDIMLRLIDLEMLTCELEERIIKLEEKKKTSKKTAKVKK